MQQEFGNGTTETPNINRLVIMLASVNYLRRSVVSRSHITCFFLLFFGHHWSCGLCVDRSGNAEISYFKSTIVHQVNVTRFYVSMHESLLVDVLNAFDHLVDQTFELLNRKRDFFVASKFH